jgi:hypothetical protein
MLSYREDQVLQILKLNGRTTTTARSIAQALQCSLAQANKALRTVGAVRVSHGQSGFHWMDATARQEELAEWAAVKAAKGIG